MPLETDKLNKNLDDLNNQTVDRASTDASDSSGADAGDSHHSMQKLEDQVKKLDQAYGEAVSQAQRTLADYANLKKRFEKEREELTLFASEMAFMRLLPAIDNLQRAVSFATEEDKKASIYMGVKMTLQQFEETLGQMGFSHLEVAAGDVFDPHVHEAVEAVEGAKDTIVEVLESGYKLRERVIRPARVKVGSGV